MIKKVIAILATVAILLAASLASPAPAFAADPGIGPSVPGFDKEDFVKIAETGFGDPMNNYAWAMTYFNGDLYVGTGRNSCWGVIHGMDLPLEIEEFLFEYITVPGDPPGVPGTKQFAEDQRAEIWRYHHGEWQRVYQSCVYWAPRQGMWLTRELGFRKLITFTNKYGENAIYAIAAGAIPPVNVILKSTDGISWERVRTPSTLCGSPSAMGSPRAMAVHKGKLYVGGGEAGAYGGGAFIWATDAPVTVLPDEPDNYPCVEDKPCLPTDHNWELVADFSAEGPGTSTAVGCLASFNGYLYAGVDNRETGFQVWRSTVGNPGTGDWTQIVNYGGGDMHNWRAACMDVLKDRLYVGTLSLPGQPPQGGSQGFLLPKGFEVFRIDTEDKCQLLVGDPIPLVPPPGDGTLRVPASGWPGGFANPLNFYCWSMQEHDGVLYLGSFDTSSFLQFLPIEELVEIPEFAQFLQLIEDNKEEIVVSLEQLIGQLEELGTDEQWIEPLRQLVEELENEPVDWEAVLQIFIDYFAGADLWKTEDGIVWEPVTLNGFDNPDNYGFRTMVTGSLYVGTANPFQGLEVWQASLLPPVGGEAYPVSKVSLLATWIVLGVVLAGGISWYALRRRRVQS